MGEVKICGLPFFLIQINELKKFFSKIHLGNCFVFWESSFFFFFIEAQLIYSVVLDC